MSSRTYLFLSSHDVLDELHRAIGYGRQIVLALLGQDGVDIKLALHDGVQLLPRDPDFSIDNLILIGVGLSARVRGILSVEAFIRLLLVLYEASVLHGRLVDVGLVREQYVIIVINLSLFVLLHELLLLILFFVFLD